MQLEQYTADTICRSMGLPRFAPAEPGSIRVLLKPSFHPEVCVTLAPDTDPAHARLSVVALTEKLWWQLFPMRLPERREEITVPASVYTDIASGFTAAHADRDPSGWRIGLDGMGIECVRITAAGAERFGEHVFAPAASAFVERLLRQVWEACRVPEIRNALADCARYVGAKYPRDVVPVRPQPVRVLVLGEPSARTDLNEALHARLNLGR